MTNLNTGNNDADAVFCKHWVNSFLIWLEQQSVKYKVIVAGNHDTSIESRFFTKKI